MLIKGGDNDFVAMADRFNIDLKLSGKELVFETKQECIDHHK